MKQKRTRTILSLLVLLVGFFSISFALAFNGPTASPGVGGGAFTIDGNGNIGVGTVTSTPATGTFGRIFAISSGTNPGLFLKSGSGNSYVLYTKTASSSFSIWDATAGEDRFVLDSSGNVTVFGNISATAFVGTLSGDVSAANVSSGVFGSLQGNGAFAFPASLGVATSSKVGLPASLSVYGDAFVRDNFGIGTGSPSSKLHLYTTGTTLDALLETSGGMNSILGVDTTGGYVGSESDHSFRIFVNNLEKVRVATSGYVGIATTTPRYALSVSGEIFATGSSTASALCLGGVCQTSWSNLGQWTSGSGGIYYQGKVSAGTSTISYPLLVSTSSDSLFALHRVGAAYPTIWKQGTDGVLVVNNANTDTFTLKDGLFGIGTTNPGYRLTVASSSGVSIDATGGRLINLGTPSASTDATTKAYVDSAVSGATSYFTLSGNSLYPTSSAYKFGLSGITSPATSLEIRATTSTATSSIQTTIGASAIGFKSSGFDGSSQMYSPGLVWYDETNQSTKPKAGIFVGMNSGGSALYLGVSGSYATGITHGLKIDAAGSLSGLAGEAINVAKLNITNVGGVNITAPSPTASNRSEITLYDPSNGAVIFNNTYTSSYYEFRKDGSPQLTIDTNGQVGVASSTMGYKLTVDGTGYISQPFFVGTPTNSSHAATKSYVDTLFTDGSFTTLTVSATTTLNGTTTINGNWNLAGAAIGNLNMNGNNIVGVNKLTVATIDPVYEIAGKKYATYVSDTIGLKMEAYGKARLTKAGSTYRYALELGKASRGSDLWLFWHTIDEGKNLEGISLNLTPEGGKANLWYEIDSQNERVLVYGDAAVKFSYHIVAPRHDTKKWPTIMTPETDDGSAPTVLPLR